MRRLALIFVLIAGALLVGCGSTTTQTDQQQTATLANVSTLTMKQAKTVAVDRVSHMKLRGGIEGVKVQYILKWSSNWHTLVVVQADAANITEPDGLIHHPFSVVDVHVYKDNHTGNITSKIEHVRYVQN